MPKDGTLTRERIMDVAQQMVLDVGLGGTSVEKVIEAAGVARGTFFYHFRTKHHLAAALLERYADQDRAHLAATLDRAERLTADPLQQLLAFLGLFIEHTDQLDAPFPGCLYASYCYQSGAIGPDTRDEMRRMMLLWRARLSALIDRVAERHPPRLPVDSGHVADHVLASLEGAFVLAKVLDDARLASEQLVQCRNYVELLFGGPAVGGAAPVAARGGRG